MKVPEGRFHSYVMEPLLNSPNNLSVISSSKNHFVKSIIWRTFFHYKEPFVQWLCKGSSWNHLCQWRIFFCVWWLFSGLLCAVIGLVVVLLDCLFPARIREVFSVGVDNEDDECHTAEGYLNSGFLEGVIYDDNTQTGNVSMSQQITTLTVRFKAQINAFALTLSE